MSTVDLVFNKDKESSKILDILDEIIKESPISNLVCLKGAYRLNQLLEERGISKSIVERVTHDLDFDAKELVVYDYFEEVIPKELERRGYSLTKKVRRFDENGTFTLKMVIHLKEDIILKIDSNLRDFNEAPADILNMLSDKIYVLSNRYVLRRSKDIYDTFIYLKYINPDYLNYNVTKLINNLSVNNKELGDFKYFKTEEGVKDILHAMHKYKPNPVKNYSVEEIFVFVQEQVLFIDKINKGVV